VRYLATAAVCRVTAKQRVYTPQYYSAWNRAIFTFHQMETSCKHVGTEGSQSSNCEKYYLVGRDTMQSSEVH
jgi:hypothetical protein